MARHQELDHDLCQLRFSVLSRNKLCGFGGGVYICFFFFQAEDGIRDYKVTGVQTCALPICADELEPMGELLPTSGSFVYPQICPVPACWRIQKSGNVQWRGS